MNNYKCYFITQKSIDNKVHGRLVYPELLIIKANDIFTAALKCHEIMSNNEKYLFVSDIEGC